MNLGKKNLVHKAYDPHPEGFVDTSGYFSLSFVKILIPLPGESKLKLDIVVRTFHDLLRIDLRDESGSDEVQIFSDNYSTP